MAASALIVSAIALTSVDRLLNSKCGLKCGFVVAESAYFNVLDSSLVFMARFFPFDYFLFSALLLYVFVATLYAIIQQGVRVAFVTIYQIRKGNTSP